MFANVQAPRNADGSVSCCGDVPEACECVWTSEQLEDAAIASFFDAAPIAKQYRTSLERQQLIPIADCDPRDGDIPSFSEYI